jgi:L-amino acid N-acyltransferase YncA
MNAVIRIATSEDARAMCAIYADYVRTTAITFELEPPSVEDFADRIRDVSSYGAWLACEIDGAVAGYAYGGRFRPRAAYRWTTELSVYVARDLQRRGIARALYTALLGILKAQGYRTAVAGATLPNEGSARLHEGMGFRAVGVFRAVGNKLGAWHDVGWWDLDLRSLPPGGPSPKPLSEIGPAAIAEACAGAAALVRR